MKLHDGTTVAVRRKHLLLGRRTQSDSSHKSTSKDNEDEKTSAQMCAELRTETEGLNDEMELLRLRLRVRKCRSNKKRSSVEEEKEEEVQDDGHHVQCISTLCLLLEKEC